MTGKQATKNKSKGKSTTTRSGSKTGTSNRAAGKQRQSSRAPQTSNEFSQAQMTTDPDEIRRWVEDRGGYPATVAGTGDDDEAGVLRIDYPGFSGQGTLQRISWDEFFSKFEQADLVFLYQEETKDGGPSRFSKLISRDQANARET